MTTKILLTGATGLIGFRILLAALEAGHQVCYTARSEAKAQTVASNPAVQRLSPGARLSSVVLPDLAADGALDAALRAHDDVTHILHVGAPVPAPTYDDPTTQVFRPTVALARALLRAARGAPRVRRVVITSSIVANVGLAPGPERASAATRLALPEEPVPEDASFGDVFSAYVAGKVVERRIADEVAAAGPHFTISHVVPGYVFGRNELALDAAMVRSQNSSNNFLVMGMLGAELPFPIHGGYAHVDDVAEVHLRVALDDEFAGKDVGIATPVDYSSIFGYVEKAFPKAVEAGVFKRGTVPTLPMNYDSSVAERLLGGKVKSFGSAVVDVAGQYLEVLGKEKA